MWLIEALIWLQLWHLFNAKAYLFKYFYKIMQINGERHDTVWMLADILRVLEFRNCNVFRKSADLDVTSQSAPQCEACSL